MAYESSIGADWSFDSSTNLSGNQYYFAVLNSSKQLAVAGANVHALGVIQDGGSAQGRRSVVRVLGITKVVCGGTFNPGDQIASDSSGRAVKYTAASVSAGTPEPLAGSLVMGVALEAGASGDVSTLMLTHSGLSN